MSVQTDVAWGALLSPVGLVALVYVMVVEAGRMRTARGEGVAGAPSPGPQTAIARYAVAARYYGLAVLGSVLFLGGWSGPGPDGFWWTIVKAFALLAVTSYIAGAVPRARPIQVASSVRLVWLPVAALNLVVVAALLEVLG